MKKEQHARSVCVFVCLCVCRCVVKANDNCCELSTDILSPFKLI